MERKLQKGQKWETKKVRAKAKIDKNKREVGRKQRREQRKVRQGLKQKENRARQIDQAAAAASTEKNTCLPTVKPKAQPMKGLPESVRKMLMATTYAFSAGKRCNGKKADMAHPLPGEMNISQLQGKIEFNTFRF